MTFYKGLEETRDFGETEAGERVRAKVLDDLDENLVGNWKAVDGAVSKIAKPCSQHRPVHRRRRCLGPAVEAEFLLGRVRRLGRR